MVYLVYYITSQQPPRIAIAFLDRDSAEAWTAKQDEPHRYHIRTLEPGVETDWRNDTW